MRSLFLKIFLCFFLTVVAVGIAMALPVVTMLIPAKAGFFKVAAVSFPILTFGISALVCFLITRHITSPLSKLRAAADGIAGGNLAVSEIHAIP